MNMLVNKYWNFVILIILLALNTGCALLFYMIDNSVTGGGVERSALSYAFQYLSWVSTGLFLVTFFFLKKPNVSIVIAFLLTMLNLFAGLGGVVCSLPFRLL